MATKTNNRYLGLVVLLALAVWGCDVVEAPYRETPVDPGPDTSKVTRKILIEDFTGFKCPNCPAAAELAKDLEHLYGGRVYSVSIHAGFYAKPDPVGDFIYDFRNEAATDLATFFKVPQYPNGMISRTLLPSATGRMLESGQWSEAVKAIIDSSAEADLAVELTNEYNESTRSLTVKVNLDYVNAQMSDNYLAVFIVEDSIVKPQIDNRRQGDQKVLDYVHNHVMRGSVNGKWWGERVSDAAIAAGAQFSREYTITLNPDWMPEHCKVLAYVHRYDPSYSPVNTNKGEYEILQVEELEVMK